jgi:hypothetical protein
VLKAATICSVATVALLFTVVLPLVSADAAQAPVDLGTASNFGILAGGGITTNGGVTTVNGDVGTSPTTAASGTGSLVVNGTNHGGDAVTQGAQGALTTAYASATTAGPAAAIVGGLGGQTLFPGVYNSASSIHLTGAVTLNAGGDPNAVFVFQAGARLTTGSASEVNLVNGAQSCNVFWQVTTSARIGPDSTFRGTVMVHAGIRVDNGTSIDGRVLAIAGPVTLDTDTITNPSCHTTPINTTTIPTTTPVVPPGIGGPAGGKAVPVAAVKAPPAGASTPVTITLTVPPSTTLPTTTTTTTTPGPGAGGVNPKRALGPQAGGSASNSLGVVAAGPGYVWAIVEGGLAVVFGVTLLGLRRRRRHIAA